ncbi:SDR family oxidoreductase [Arsenicitalea aurantiaca]|uniref:SDR family oxidoreductase n=1 Tax=Arsenicitalea aurantiaca TaxID=1783274 RepID=A0A433X403_9HYPH|nr:SDR family oxidoreductase [Arsenicitalea aurantiaca]RUT28796.1 SDR family oxidoreductase [Arsenicitalea aurantiaca]
MGRLDGKTAFVTAGGAGIGGAVALAFAREGARVIATDRDAGTLEKVAEQLRGIGGDHETHVLDVTDHEGLREAAARHADVDTLFNCAGWVHEGMLETTSLADWDRSFAINVTGMFVLTQAFLPHFLGRGKGNVINVASVASSLKGVPNRLAYMTTKAAVIGFTKSIAFDYMSRGIRANAICPGSVDSPSLHDRANRTGDHDKAWAGFIARQPMGRMAQPDEMAHIAVYLASDESAYATGANFVVDGGITL